MEFDLGATLDWLDRHEAAHPEPNAGCAFCERPRSPEAEVKAELAEQLGRPATRAEVAAHPKMLAWDARQQYEIAVIAAQFGAQPKG